MDNNNIYNLIHFGHTLKIIREKNKLTQEALSEQAGISLYTYFNIEKGKVLPQPETIIAIGNVYGIDLLKLMVSDYKEPISLNDKEMGSFIGQ